MKRVMLGTMLLGVAVLWPAASHAATANIVDSMTLVRPGEHPDGAQAARIRAAQNEFESFEVVVDTGSGGSALNDVTVSVPADLQGPGGATIPSGNISLYRVGYYTVKRVSDRESPLLHDAQGTCTSTDCRVPDVLIPERDRFFPQEDRNAFPMNVPAGENRVAFVDVQVPQTQAPGLYQGAVQVRGTGFSVDLPLSLGVLDFALPSTTSVRGAFATNDATLCRSFAGGACPGGKWAMHARFTRLGLDNRISLSEPGAGPPGGANAASFDSYVLPYLNGTGPTKLPGARVTDVTLERWDADAVAAWKTQAAAGGYLDKLTFFCDEVGRTTANWLSICEDHADTDTANGPFSDYKAANALWKSTAPANGDLPVALVGSIYDLQFGRSQGYSAAANTRTLIPLVTRMDNTRYGNGAFGQTLAGNQRETYDPFLAEAPGQRLWMYTSCMAAGCGSAYSDFAGVVGYPAYLVDQPASEARGMSWQLFNYRSTGDYHFETVLQSGLVRTVNADGSWGSCVAPGCLYGDGANGDGTLFYPGNPATIGGAAGTDIPLETLRLKLIRDGREDYEYLARAVALGKEADARRIAGGPYCTGDCSRELFPHMGMTGGNDESGAPAVTPATFEARRDELITLISPQVATPTPTPGGLAPILRSVDAPSSTLTAEVTFGLDATDDLAVTELRVGDDPGVWGAWQPFVASVAHTLPGVPGAHTVYVQVRDAGNRESEVVSRITTWLAPTPIVDTVPAPVRPPPAPVTGSSAPMLRGVDLTASTLVPDVTLTIDATDDLAVTEVRTANDSTAWGAWRPFATQIVHALPTSLGVHTVFVQVRDAGYRESGIVSRVTTLVAPAPIVVAAPNAAPILKALVLPKTTRTQLVSVQLDAIDDHAVTGMRLANEDGNWQPWQHFRARFDHLLTPKAMTKGVFAQVRDAAGLTSTIPFKTTLCSPCTPPPLVLRALAPGWQKAVNRRRSFSTQATAIIPVVGTSRADRLTLDARRQHVDLGQRDGVRDVLDCGAGGDTALRWPEDVTLHCETVVIIRPPGRASTSMQD